MIGWKSIRKIMLAVPLLIGGLTAPLWSAQSAVSQDTLTYAVGSFGGELLDPVVSKAETIHILVVMFDSLFDVDENGQLTPGLLTSWEVSDDSKVWTLHVREGVVFHDGSPMTAEDVKFTLEHSQIEEAQRGGFWRETLGVPPNVEILDPYTLRVTFPSPQPNFGAFSTHVETPYMFVIPKAYIEEHGIDYFNKNPVGTGPYKFVRLVPGQEMVFQAVDYQHWRVQPEFEELRILEVPEETTRVAMLETGQIDLATVGLENAVRLRDAGFTLANGTVSVADANFIGTYLPEAKGMPLSDVRVRQALSLAINREEIAETLLGGFGSADVVNIALDWTTPIWTQVPELAEKWRPKLKELYRYDPEEAKRLITEAGYPNGFQFTYWVSPETSAPFMADLMQAVAGYWSAVGANVQIVQVDSAAWSAVRNTNKSLELVGKGGSNAQGVRNIAFDSFRFFTNFGNLNVLAGTPEETQVSDLVLKGWSVYDPKEQAPIFDQLLEITTASWASWPIVVTPRIMAFGPRVQGDLKHDLANAPYNFAYFKVATN